MLFLKALQVFKNYIAERKTLGVIALISAKLILLIYCLNQMTRCDIDIFTCNININLNTLTEHSFIQETNVPTRFTTQLSSNIKTPQI